MKSPLLTILAGVVCSLLLPVFMAAAAPPPGYYLAWSDEFNSSSLDMTKWDYWLLGNRRDAVNVASAVSVGGGNLTITTYTTNSTHYTAMIATDTTFLSRNGYWETSAAWGDTNGMWSAIWMQSPTMGTYLDDPFISGSELDIVEHRSTDGGSNGNIINQAQNNIHWNGYGSAAKSAGSGNIGNGLGSGFHTYGFLWTASAYTLYVDGSNLRSWNYANNGVPVSESCEWFILSSEVDDTSTTWAGTIPSGGYGNLGTSRTKLTVDYVRYYAPTNTLFWTGSSSTDLTSAANYVASLAPLPTSDLTFSYLSGNNLSPVLGASVTVDSLVFLYLKNGLTIGGANTLNLGAGGVDMLAANHSVTISCPLNLTAAQTWNIGRNNPGNTLLVSGNIAGSGTLSKGSYGTVVLSGTNSFTGTLSVGTGSGSANEGALQLASSGAAANAAAISLADNNSGSATLQLTGGIIVPPPVTLSGRNTNVAAIENLSGSNTLAGNLTINSGGAYYLLQSDAGTLNLGGTVAAGSSATGARTVTFRGAGNHFISGSLQNGSATPLNASMLGTGSLTLAGANTFSGTLSIGNGQVKVGHSLALQNATLNLPCAGTNVLTFTSPLTASIAGLSGLSDLWLTNSSLGAVTLTNGNGNVSSTFGGALKGSGNLVKAGTGTLTLTATNAYTGSTIVAGGTLRFAPATNLMAFLQPVLWFNFEAAGNGVITNLGTGGWALNGSIIGAGAYVTNTGRFGNALYCNGVGGTVATNIVQVLSKTTDTSASASWSIGFWLNTTTAGAVILYQGDGTWSSAGQTTFYLNAGSTAAGGTHAGAVRYAGGWLTGTASLADGNWHFITLVDNAGVEIIYVDGKLDTAFSTMSGGLSAGANQIWLGGSPDAGDGTVKLNGLLDDFCIFSRALSAAEIRAIYTNAPVLGNVPAGSPLSIAGGAALDLSGISQSIASLADESGTGGVVTNNANSPATLNVGNNNLLSANFSGTIADGSVANALSLVKTGNSTQVLSGKNNYHGTTTISNGTLIVNGTLGTNAVAVRNGTLTGNGKLSGPLMVYNSGTLAIGSNNIGTLTISNSVTLGGALLVKLNKSQWTNDALSGLTSLTCGGSLTVTNLGGTLTAGDRFKLYQAMNVQGLFAATNLPALAPGLGWNLDAASGWLSVVQAISLIPPSVGWNLNGSNLSLSWPTDHVGWRLLVQTNQFANGISLNPYDWDTVPGSTQTNQFILPIDPTRAQEFYRLVFP
ncbi:MAG: autotransporter-associated beta strand repeat-containing protein [Verrucomicrobiota bacterium]